MYTYSILFCFFPLALSNTTTREKTFFTVRSTTIKTPHQDNPAPVQLFTYYAPQYYVGCDNKVKSSQNERYIIRNAHSTGLVVDASTQNKVQVARFTGIPEQLWKFEQVTPGVYYIISDATGYVLDNKKRLNEDIVETFVSKKINDNPLQHWVLNSNGRIFNIGKGANLDVASANFKDGNPLILWENNGHVAQQFRVERYI